MKRKRYFKLMHINLTKDLFDYLSWRSEKSNTSISELVRYFIRENLLRDRMQLVQDENYMYDRDRESDTFRI